MISWLLKTASLTTVLFSNIKENILSWNLSSSSGIFQSNPWFPSSTTLTHPQFDMQVLCCFYVLNELKGLFKGCLKSKISKMPHQVHICMQVLFLRYIYVFNELFLLLAKGPNFLECPTSGSYLYAIIIAVLLLCLKWSKKEFECLPKVQEF
mgnify:CR=1 FL=1